MNRIILAFVTTMAALLVCLQAGAKPNTKTGYVTATVVSVEKHVLPTNYLGSPSDAPLQAETYSYDVGIRLNCNLYTGRYESATDYLPSELAANHTVDVRLDKHVIYVSLSNQDREVKMGIVARKHLRGQVCPASS